MRDATLVLVIVALGVLVALVYFPWVNRSPSPLRSVLKTLPLVLFALAMFGAFSPALLIGALLLSAMGDLALSREGRRAFLAGLSAFALAHVAYVGLFLDQGQPDPLAAVLARPMGALAMLGLAGSTEVWLTPHARDLRWPVRVYVLVITAMGLAALGTGDAVLIAGAGLFILSDFLLALRMFRLAPVDPWTGPSGWGVWLFYIAGQFLIMAAITL